MSTWSTAILIDRSGRSIRSGVRIVPAPNGSNVPNDSNVPNGLGRDGDALHRKDFDHVADLQVVVILQADAALEAGLDLAHVVLEAPQRADLAFEHHHVVTQ